MQIMSHQDEVRGLYFYLLFSGTFFSNSCNFILISVLIRQQKVTPVELMPDFQSLHFNFFTSREKLKPTFVSGSAVTPFIYGYTETVVRVVTCTKAAQSHRTGHFDFNITFLVSCISGRTR